MKRQRRYALRVGLACRTGSGNLVWPAHMIAHIIERFRKNTSTYWYYITLRYVTLRYITLHYFPTPLTPEVTSGASTKSYWSFIGELKQVSFQLFLKSICVRKILEIGWKTVPCLWSSVPIRNSAHQAWVTFVGFPIGNCWRNGVFHDRVYIDRRWLSSCQPGRQDCDRCAPGA